MKRSFERADLRDGIHVGDESGLILEGENGTFHVWDSLGRYSEERRKNKDEWDALYRVQVSKADLFEHMLKVYDESYGRETNIEGFRKDMEELRKHTGTLTENQWKKLRSLEYEIEGNANRLFVAIGCARELEREINYSQKRLEKLRASIYAAQGQTDNLERFYQNHVNRS